ncbi:MAG: o-succinylbenzoate--CoA ligase [Schumannella sp.]|nr:o-succinylbenzoate--CoA ligase [Schumannella sp.]
MTRELRAVPPGDGVLAALRDALAGGPALFVEVGSQTGSSGSENARLRRQKLPANVEQRVALVVKTSGSTGAPKRVMLSADAVLASAAASESALGGPGQWVLALPTQYIAGLNVLARSIAAGFDPAVVRGDGFTAKGFVAAARSLTEKVRFTSLVPAQLATLLDDVAAVEVLRDFSRVLVGGQASPRALLDRAADAGVRLTRTYGSSETCGGCVYDGRPIGQAAVRVEDDEVWLGGPTLADGYLGDPERTAERFVVADGAHWFRTADAGIWDGERLAVTGRRDDVVVSGGVKVSLGAVERVLRESVADAVVVAASDQRWGEVPVVITASDADVADAIAAVGRELGAPARPARVIRVAALPLLPSGKVDRVTLAALAARAAD